jgi:nicotinamide-nucleotide amidase
MTRLGEVAVITIGDELLLGQTIDSNAAFISRELAKHGFRVAIRITVGDDEEAISNSVRDALDRSRVVICTGGLGPTQDDFTKPVVARLFGADLVLDEQLLEQLRERFRQRGIVMAERNICQAEVPRGARVLPNPRGTAPGLLLTRDDGACCILLPGVPHEMRGLILEQVIPFLEQRATERAHPISYRTLRTTGIAESAVAEKLDGVVAAVRPLTLAFLPSIPGTDLRITCWGDLGESDAAAAIAAAETRIRSALQSHIYGADDDDLAAVVGELLRAQGLTVAVAESCTGGLVGKRLTDAAGSSDYFLGGIIAYANQVKHELLGVSINTLREHGAVSEAVAREMAAGARRQTGASAAIAITGVAGPGGGTPDKPVGTVWIAASLNQATETRRSVWGGDREEIRERAAQAGLALLWKLLRAPAASATPVAQVPVHEKL